MPPGKVTKAALRGMLHPSMAAFPEMPETLPWLATVILPAMQIANPQDLHWMADFEQCLAAAIIAKRQTTDKL